MEKLVFGASQSLARAADIAIREVLAVKKGERVLIITNPLRDVYKVSQALYVACVNAKAAPALIVQPKKISFDNAEPAVISAIKSEPEVIISISAERMGKDREALAKPYKGLDGKPYTHIFDQLLEGLRKTRSFWSPTVTVDMFVRTVPIDYAALKENCAKVEASFKSAKTVHVQTDLGTDIKVGVKGRKARSDDGDCRRPGKGGNLPAGEVFISPKLGESNGVVVFDGSITLDKTLVIKKPVKVTVERGHVTNIEGGREAKRLRDYLHKAGERPYELAKKGELTMEKAKEYSRNSTNLGELGIGLNPKAKIVGNVLEDEKVLGTVHFAIGSNYDQDALALIHSDGIVKKPTITIDQKTTIMKRGRMLL
ncbi:MAG: aminopeptidase [Candidatus Bathyarchaeota archaeon]|nr:aminopeptidase [Candidatus Bathyarchaeota archaeon]